jgi:tetratricopeptide (TPR) repeat protein
LPASWRQKLKNQMGELLFLLAHSADNPRQAMDYNRRAEVCFEPDVPVALWLQRGLLHERAGQKKEALACKERARAMETKTIRDRTLQARVLATQGRYKEARQLLELAVQAEPGYYLAWYVLGVCYDNLAQDVRAITCYTACVALAPDFHGAYLNRGMARLRQKDFKGARADLDRAVELWPKRAEIYIDRALVRQALDDPKGALADLDEAVKRGIGLTRVYFMRARLKRRLGDEPGARRDEAEGLKREPSDELSWVARGMARLRGDPKGALADFEQALKVNPRTWMALMNKAHVLSERLGRNREASQVLDELLKLYPEHVPALSGQAVLLARLGQRQKAHELIAEALVLDPTGEVRYQAACVYALTSPQVPGDAERALAYLRQAIDDRYGLEILDRDDDLAALRGKPAFDRVVQAARLLRPAGR